MHISRSIVQNLKGIIVTNGLVWTTYLLEVHGLFSSATESSKEINRDSVKVGT